MKVALSHGDLKATVRRVFNADLMREALRPRNK